MFYLTATDIHYSNMFNEVFGLEAEDLTIDIADDRDMDSNETLIELLNDDSLLKKNIRTCVFGCGEDDSWYCLLASVVWTEKEGGLVSNGSEENQCMIEESGDMLRRVFCIGIMKNHLTMKTVISIQRSEADPEICFRDHNEFDKVESSMRSVLFDLHSTFYSPRNKWRRICDMSDTPYIIGLELDRQQVDKLKTVLTFKGDGDLSRDNLIVIKHKSIESGYLAMKFRMFDILNGNSCEFVDKSEFGKRVNSLVKGGMVYSAAIELVKAEGEAVVLQLIRGDLIDSECSDCEEEEREFVGSDGYGWGEDDAFDEDAWRNINQD